MKKGQGQGGDKIGLELFDWKYSLGDFRNYLEINGLRKLVTQSRNQFRSCLKTHLFTFSYHP